MPKGILIIAVRLPAVPYPRIEYGEKVGRCRMPVGVLRYQHKSLTGNAYRYRLIRLMTAVGYPAILHIALAQMGKVYERHAAEQEHQQKISKYRLLLWRKTGKVGFQQLFHLAGSERTLGLRHHTGIDIVEESRIVLRRAGRHPTVVNGTQSTHVGGYGVLRQFTEQHPLFVLFQATGCEDFLHRHGALLLPAAGEADEGAERTGIDMYCRRLPVTP